MHRHAAEQPAERAEGLRVDEVVELEAGTDARVLGRALDVSDAVQLAVEVEADDVASRECVTAAVILGQQREDGLDLSVGRGAAHAAVDVDEGEDAVGAVDVVHVEDRVGVVVVRLARHVQLVHPLERLDHVGRLRKERAEHRGHQLL